MSARARGFTAAALFLASLAIALAALAPATLLDRLVSDASAGRVAALAARGTVWQGSARLVLADGRGEAVPIQWSVSPGSLWRGTVAAQVTLAGGTPIPVTLGLRSIELGPGEWRVPAALVAAFDHGLAGYRPRGTLVARIAELKVADGRGRIRAEAEWIDAGFLPVERSSVGSARLAIAGDDRAADLRVTPLRGPLLVAGTGRWTPSGIEFEGTARTDAGISPADPLHGWLRLAARELPDGSYSFRVAAPHSAAPAPPGTGMR